MSNIWHDLEESRVKQQDFIVVVEIAKNSKKKYELDKSTGMIVLDRILYTSTHYPANYGFIPRTYGEDHDPLDALVLCSEALDPLVLVRCYPIGVVLMEDDGARDEKIIAIPFGDPAYREYKDIHDLPAHIFREMLHFFNVYKDLEGKKTIADHVLGHEEAERFIGEAIERYKTVFTKQ
ncbi:Inorganic pyrophosphatase [bioreactor metagenome]|uniref:Inorganic pyrophosphatase n=1 Tax=bioreactor metagenome TaxID=1076179 RepID=A0A644XB11_9ZZZZ